MSGKMTVNKFAKNIKILIEQDQSQWYVFLQYYFAK